MDAPPASADSCWIAAGDLLTSSFVARHTEYATFDALFHAGGLTAERFANLSRHNDHSWEAFIRKSSCFSDWQSMLREARGEWLMRRLGVFDA
jgi:hypothetical protein